MGFRRWKLSIPAPTPTLIWAVVLTWSFCFVFLECGAKVEARKYVPLVGDVANCHRGRAPQFDELVEIVSPGTMMTVRSTQFDNGETCYKMELGDGRMGWVPWHPAYLRSAGWDIRWTLAP